jgi:DNA polymerase-3 subunit epsilon
MDLNRPWPEFTFVAFDTETSGAYPLGADVVEFGAVKWRQGQVVDRFETLLQPREKMSNFIIGIHGITNEMVESAPVMRDKLDEIREFFRDTVLMAHHAPFDMGFMAVEFEKLKKPMPTEPVLCTSLLSRKLISESPNHKLQTLIKVLKLEQGAAHRAGDDARACLEVGLECMRRAGVDKTLPQIQGMMGKELNWGSYSLFGSRDSRVQNIIEALSERRDLDIVYEGGSVRGSTRRISPIGIVRNPDGDYVMAICHLDRAQKRFYINKIKDIAVVHASSVSSK